ncbi:MAG: 2-oxoacid:acceptor oxidoreductase subunit alpha [Candidatus Njordarchaeia archaeon]
MIEDISIMIAGAAGDGVMQSGRMLGKTFTRQGFHVYINNEYPSLIRGGHNTSHVRVGVREIWSHSANIDFLIALNKESIDKHLDEMSNEGSIIYDSTLAKDVKVDRDDLHLYPIPMTKIVKELKTRPVVRNAIGIGALLKLLGLNLDTYFEIISETFRGKEKVIDININAAKLGYDTIKDEEAKLNLQKYATGKRKLLLSGNEAVGLGAIKAGLKFFAAYPITPASPLFHYLAGKQYEKNIVVLQAESEVAAINMVMGAAYAGVRAMTATSGTGFGLMVEGFGAVAMTESPVVVGLVMRPGPGSGMPTFTSQADLRFVLHASHGEFARVVIAPGDVEEAFYLAGEAFNIAEKYQLPVIILYDKFLAEGYKSVESLDESKIKIDRGKIEKGKNDGKIDVFLRYKLSEDHVSPRIFPGTPGYVVNVNITEHDETGWSKIIPSVRDKMAKKRIMKIETIKKENYQWTKLHGDPESKIGVISWGSTKGPILEAMHYLSKEGIKLKFLQIVFLEPFPRDQIKEFIDSTEKLVQIEGNYTGQLGSLLKEKLYVDPKYKLLRDNGLQYTPSDIINFLKKEVL